MPLSADPKDRLKRARLSLEGLATGDAFGQTFFSPEIYNQDPFEALATPPWYWTDDTAMALSIYANLEKYGEINQDDLAQDFAGRYINDRNRGYGPAMHRLLYNIANDGKWQIQSKSQFNGSGSFGNGSAMRAPVLGAYFADDLEKLKEQAALSAEVTHAHPEGIAGAIAVALGAAWACRIADGESSPGWKAILADIASNTPDSETADAIRRASFLQDGATERLAVSALGNGEGLSCQDTVPFALWSVVQSLFDYEKALRTTAAGGGDVDTTCAIVGGIVVLSAGRAAIPEEWLLRREKLPQWVYVEMKG